MKFEMFKVSIESLLLRFVLLMAVVIIGAMLSQLWMVLFAFPLLASMLLGLKVSFKPVRKTSSNFIQKPSTLVS